MEDYFCNICERSIEPLSLEKHVKESEHVARKKKLEEQLENNNKFSKSIGSAVDLWKND